MPRWVFYFGEKGKEDKLLLGGKGANLSEMTKLGLPIPSGFCISTKCCIAFQKEKAWPFGLDNEMRINLARLEKVTGKTFGDSKNPLLVSVRSGAAVSMPGMMDTVLNIGLNDDVIANFAANKGPRFAYDSYRRFLMMFGDVVLDIKRSKFEHYIEEIKHKNGYKLDNELSVDDLKQLCNAYKQLVKRETGKDFPMDPQEQLIATIDAVFLSWDNPRAIEYRRINRISDDLGTAVSVQEMVFGNMGDDSATGVAFTRNPSTGENKRYGEYLRNAQGEDVVAGIRTPRTITDMKVDFPDCAKQLYDLFDFLENHYHDMQDIEFTIEKQKLYILQTRNGKRTAAASVKMAMDMLAEGLIDAKTAVLRVDPEKLDTLLHKQIDPSAKKSSTSIVKGLPASPGAAVGEVVFTAEAAVAAKEAGRKVILVRLETSPEDISGMAASEGILTARGGMTSHAAVVARGMNICCVSGCSEIALDEEAETFSVGDVTIAVGDVISLDGSTGDVYVGALPVVAPSVSGEFDAFLKMADGFANLEVFTNADTPHDAAVARGFGAKGIGLTRTEHMFFNKQRISAVREMVLADNTPSRQVALDKLLPFQRADFKGILGEMSGTKVVIRLIDPPLHEFLPHEDKEQQELANDIAGGDIQKIKDRVASLHEFNPMLGFRGCRLGVVYPEINAMQVTAIFEAAIELVDEGKKPLPCIEVPLTGNVKEFLLLKKLIKKLAKSTGAEGKVHYEIGTMIEVPRAALRANEFAAECDFLSFGTNDLTQMTCGFSRDDSGVFLKEYVKQKIYARDPFQSIDQEGVGRLMRICVTLARAVNPTIDIGICGEHGGDPSSVIFCHKIGLDNVSCSPYRVPTARLAAAHAAILHGSPQTSQLDSILLKANL